MSKLVIIEAPGKLPKFKKALGSEYEVLATVGHCIDLPEKSLSIDIKKDFEPTWEVLENKHDVVEKIKSAAKKASVIYLMSLPSNEEIILLNRQNQFLSTPIGKFVNDVQTGKTDCRDFQAACFKGLNVLFRPITGIVKHVCQYEYLLRFTLANNRKVVVTPNHSLFSGTQQKIASEIKIGDGILCCSKLPLPERQNPVIKLNLLDVFSDTDDILVQGGNLFEEMKKFQIDNIISSDSCNKKSTIIQINRATGESRKSYARKSTFLSSLNPSILRKLSGIKIKKRGSNTAVSSRLNLNLNKLCRLAGFYAAEGSMNKTAVRFHFSGKHIRKESIWIKEVICLTEHLFGVTPHVYDDNKLTTCEVRIENVLVKEILKYLEFSTGAHRKSVPGFVFQSPENAKLQFLRALFLGDGSLQTNSIVFNTVSRRLANDIFVLLLSIGVNASIYRSKPVTSVKKNELIIRNKGCWHVSISGYSDIQKIKIVWKDHWNAKKVTFRKHKSKLVHVNDISPQLSLLPVRKIEKIRAPKYVYDLSVKGYENFLTTSGIFCHNTDEDREGEAIAKHISNQIQPITKAPIYRATTNEITSAGIKKAIANPGHINENKFDAYICRRLLDRLCGYKTSYLTYQSSGGKSAGRVQSAVLRVIVDREKEIISFIPEEYWILTAHLRNSKDKPFDATLTDKIKVPNEKTATEIYNKVITAHPVIKSVDVKQACVNPFAPFTTIPMQATASTLWGWSATKTMKVAQHLYENAFITYHRSDSPFMAQEAVDMVRAFIDHSYGPSYLPKTPPVYTPKKGAQEAHECCRVVDVNAHVQLDQDHKRLYDVIWKRTVASQMLPGVDERIKAVTDIGGYDFISRGNRVIFDGFRKVWDVGKGKEAILPELKQGEKCTLSSLDKNQKFTTPPPRYSIASLGKKCEENQIARPSTFANFIETLLNRKYIKKAGTSFQPTELGIKVIDFLVSANFCFVDLNFTSQMEELLDEIQKTTKSRLQVLKDFWQRLKTDIENGKNIKKHQEITDFDCPKCHGKLLKKHSKFGPFFSCENYKPKKKDTKSKTKKKDEKPVDTEKSCSYIANVGEHGEPVEKTIKVKEYTDFKCIKCDGKMVKRKSSYGEFAGCENFPTCRMTSDLEGNFKELSSKKKWGKKKWGKKQETTEDE